MLNSELPGRRKIGRPNFIYLFIYYYFFLNIIIIVPSYAGGVWTLLSQQVAVLGLLFKALKTFFFLNIHNVTFYFKRCVK